ncbi:MAG: efflux RND transporter periplasmic adaptor subunit [Acidobacteriota bacterium]
MRCKSIFLFLAFACVGLLMGCGGGPGEASEGADSSSRQGAGGPPGGGGRSGGRGGGRGGPPGGFGGFGGGDAGPSAIPVEVARVERRSISDYLETNGSLEAENEVDIVSRTMGPIVELNVEEGMFVREGDVLARIDDRELQAQLEIAKVSVEEARLAYERAKVSWEAEIISKEVLDQAKSRLDAAAAQIRSSEIQLGYTVIEAPFSGLIIERVIKLAEHVPNAARLFRLSDFTPLLCEVQLPEKDLGRLRRGQRAYLTVEAFPQKRFDASVLRINPVVDATTGTVRTTLSVNGQNQLRPGMFASVFLQISQHDDALVVPKEALVLESIGDAVFVVTDGVVERREVEVGFSESDSVEILNGLSQDEQVVIIGQDSLSDGTEVTVLAERGRSGPPSATGEARSAEGSPEGAQQRPQGPRRGPPPGFDPSNMTPEMEERIRDRMKQRGLSDDQIEERLEQMRQGNFPGRGPGGPPGGASGGDPR